MARLSPSARGREARARLSLVAAVGIAAAAFVDAPPPAAALGYAPASDAGQNRPARKTRRAKPPRETKRAEPGPSPDRPLFAVISLGGQHISIYNHKGLVERSAVSTGMPGHPTPQGVFTILGRERFHRSNLYSGAPMPFMQRITWSGVAMHLGVVPGHPASHGCIRLPGGFAAKLWGLTRIGERVVIAPHDLTPSAFSHPLLPTPKMQAPLETRTASSDAPSWQEASATAAPAPLVDPHRYAMALKAKAAADAAETSRLAKEAAAAVAPEKAEAARAGAELKAATTARSAAQAKAAAAAKAFEAAAASPDKAEASRAAKEAADAALAEAETRFLAAQQALDARTAAATEAAERAHLAAQAAATAVKAEKDAQLRTAPISVLVSKRDHKVYVRQGLTPLFEAPASVRDPERPLGSHLYIASATNGDGRLEWSVLSMPTRYAEARAERRRNKKGRLVEERTAAPLGPSSSAAEALERIEIADDVRERIAERLWLGGSIIVSDQPLSNETSSAGTDLTVKFR